MNGDISMHGYYICIKGVSDLNTFEQEELKTLFTTMMINPDIWHDGEYLVFIDTVEPTVSWDDIITSISSDFLTDLRLYESPFFPSKQALMNHYEQHKDKDIFIKTYNNDKELFYKDLVEGITEDTRKEVFKSLYNDKEFLNSIRIFLKNNQNKSKAAKEANLHRNTLDNRLDKFYRITGYNLSLFRDAAIIYLLLKDY